MQVSIVVTLSSPEAPVWIAGSKSPLLYSRKTSAKESMALVLLAPRTSPIEMALV